VRWGVGFFLAPQWTRPPLDHLGALNGVRVEMPVNLAGTVSGNGDGSESLVYRALSRAWVSDTEGYLREEAT